MSKIERFKQISKDIKITGIVPKEFSGLNEFDFPKKDENMENNMPGSGRIVPKEFANFGDLFETDKKK